MFCYLGWLILIYVLGAIFFMLAFEVAPFGWNAGYWFIPAFWPLWLVLVPPLLILKRLRTKPGDRPC